MLVVNCRSRRASKLRPRAEALIRSRGFTITRTFAVTDPSTLDDVLREAMAEQPPLLVLGSGDGTVASVVDHLAGTNTVLGYLPMGTTNNLARSLGLPMRLRRSVALLETGIVADIDLGLADGDYFANMASIGVSVAVSDRTPHRLKRVLGRPAYALTGAAALRTSAPFLANITVDGIRYQLHTHQLNVANGSVHAGTRIAVDAGIDDGRLVAYTLGGPPAGPSPRPPRPGAHPEPHPGPQGPPDRRATHRDRPAAAGGDRRRDDRAHSGALSVARTPCSSSSPPTSTTPEPSSRSSVNPVLVGWLAGRSATGAPHSDRATLRFTRA